MKIDEASQTLRELARAAGIEHVYRGWDGQPVGASAAALRAVLAELGVHVADAAREHDALAALEREHWREVVPPVLVAWSDAASGAGKRGLWLDVPMRVPADLDVACELELTTEGGAVARVTGRLFEASASGHAWPASLGGGCYCIRRARIEIPAGELGYHTLRWQVGVMPGQSTVIAAPVRAWGAPGDGARRWGVFAPLYAARTAASGHTGDLAVMRRLLAEVARRGGDYVATLPLLAAFLDEPCQVSPYSPASRLFWNELYAELDGAPPAVTAGPLVDYRAQYAARRGALAAAARTAWADPAQRDALAAAADGALLDYALFRALGERARAPWSRWDAADRDRAAPTVLAAIEPALLPGVEFHVWAQRTMSTQLAAIKRAAGDGGGLYLDLPVGEGIALHAHPGDLCT